VELAAKARIADENIVLLAPGQHFRSAVALWRSRNDLSSLPRGIRTVGAQEALTRLGVLFPHLSFVEGEASELLDLRNDEVHLGVVDQTTRIRTLAALVRSVNAILETFWAPHSELVRVTLDENAERILRVVNLKISAAIERFRNVSALPSEQRDALLTVIANRAEDHDLEEATVDCPACGSVAVATGQNELQYGEPDIGRDASFEGVDSWLTFTPSSMRCEACALHLTGAAELDAARVPLSWINRDDDALQTFREMEAELYEYADTSDYVPEAESY
jgi:hypothetical protein